MEDFMLVEIHPELFINPEEVAYVTTSRQKVEGYSEPQEFVAIVMKKTPTMYLNAVSFARVISRLNGECRYESVWTDEVGTIPVCVNHENNSRFDESVGPTRPCLTIDPYPRSDHG
jgi:hypothetical protein